MVDILIYVGIGVTDWGYQLGWFIGSGIRRSGGFIRCCLDFIYWFDKYCCDGSCCCNMMILLDGGIKGGFEEVLISDSMFGDIASISHGVR